MNTNTKEVILQASLDRTKAVIDDLRTVRHSMHIKPEDDGKNPSLLKMVELCISYGDNLERMLNDTIARFDTHKRRQI